MYVHIVYAHPSTESFTHAVLVAFMRGLFEARHSHTVSDLYAMSFNPELGLAEYEREHNYHNAAPVPDDVVAEQDKLNAADVWAFIYPVWWTDCPAKLKGWFDRVWTVGFAYHPQTVEQAKKAIVICTAGHTVEHLRETGCYQAMETVMLTDRIYDRAKAKEFIVLGGSEALSGRAWEQQRHEHLVTARDKGRWL
ncbi:MAG: NAD(P)H-dependent oxidoreductase [Coriobacteriales bacterium]|jgi:NAD(P)H dehydrogenase (quinone)|nr:NAD(P)H-dependent oxidoreductase [Coriobacteriales bacterium]